MKQLVRHTIRQYHMLPDGARVLCGLSGGADSVSLVLCLQELGYQVCACHLNHGMRGTQADADEAFCRDFCEKHNIPFVSERCDVFAEAERRKLSAETAAREMRYDFFARCAERMQVPYLATAHTADDNLETMLFHLIRGTGSAGLAGIPPVRGSIVRPLIAVERRQIERFLIERGQNWCTDATNLDDSCTRNKIRHHVIPALRDIEPCAARHALEAAQLVRQDNTYLDAQAREELAAMHKTTTAICDWLEAHPESLPKARRFAEYYIPTTLKLLHTYNDVQGQQGENAETIRRDIAGILHTLNQAYDTLYDTLLSDVAMDVSSEIAALQGMLANDGLTGGNFE